MTDRPTYSLQILLGTIAAFAVAAGAFAAPESIIAGLLVLVIGTCLPALLVVVWRSGCGYRRTFVIGAMVPSLLGAVCELIELVHFAGFQQQLSPGYYNAGQILIVASVYHRGFVLALTAIAVSGGLAAVGMHWLMRDRETETPTPLDNESLKCAAMDNEQPTPAGVSRLAPSRRWLQFRLKWLLVLITALAIPLSWLSWKLEEKRRERWAETELSKFSVVIMRNYVADDDPFGDGENLPPPGPAWLRRILGDDLFIHVESVASCPSRLDPDINLDHLSGPAQEGLSDNPPLTDADLLYLRYLPQLRELSLSGSEVTDAGLRQLYSLLRLESLDLSETKVSAGAVEELQRALRNCKIQAKQQARG